MSVDLSGEWIFDGHPWDLPYAGRVRMQLQQVGTAFDLGRRCRLGEKRFEKPREPIDAGDKQILHAAILQFIEDAQPEFSTLILADPQAQELFPAVQIDA